MCAFVFWQTVHRCIQIGNTVHFVNWICVVQKKKNKNKYVFDLIYVLYWLADGKKQQCVGGGTAATKVSQAYSVHSFDTSLHKICALLRQKNIA